MKKQRLLNNKGFSLVELIIVIAIMAILVGVLAPSLLRYVEKTNVSADTQLADAVRTAVVTAMMDPSVINAKNADGSPEGSEAAFTAYHADLKVPTNDSLKGAFLASVNETLGLTSANGSTVSKDLVKKLKSTHGTDAKIQIQVTAGNAVRVVISKTDNTGEIGRAHV